ncbi:MAG: hypothetical protein AB2708_08350, partial [Candidatus Thiodiazotropha taylori]
TVKSIEDEVTGKTAKSIEVAVDVTTVKSIEDEVTGKIEKNIEAGADGMTVKNIEVAVAGMTVKNIVDEVSMTTENTIEAGGIVMIGMSIPAIASMANGIHNGAIDFARRMKSPTLHRPTSRFRVGW